MARSWVDVRTPPLGIDLSNGGRIDPYLVWSALCGFPGHAGTREVPLLVECKATVSDVDDALLVQAGVTRDELDPLLQAIRSAVLAGPQACYLTVTVQQSLLPVLVWLVAQGFLERFQLGAARLPTTARPARAIVPALGLPPGMHFRTLGVVDDGCSVAHSAFRQTLDGGGVESRFLFVWDQNTADSPAPWGRFEHGSSPPGFPAYGCELDRSRLSLLLQDLGLGEEPERRFYDTVLLRPRWGRGGRTHGAGVLQLLAGDRRVPGSPVSMPAPPEAPLIFVQLPDRTVEDTSGGSLGFYVLDAARYVVQRTRESVHPSDNWSTTINISLGSIAGPHDGTSITEKALDLLASDSRVCIVMAAGNTAGRGIHALRPVSSGQSGRFLVMVPPGNPRESYVELWLPPHRVDGSVLDVHDFSVEVTAPDGSNAAAVGAGGLIVLEQRDALLQGGGAAGPTVLAAVVFAKLVAQGLAGTMVLLAVRPTWRQPAFPGPVAPAGVWSIELKSSHAVAAEVHAWVERNDTVIGRRRVQQSHFVHDDRLHRVPSYLTDEATLSSIANGQATVVAGAYDHHRGREAGYSARGPVLRAVPAASKPDRFGPSERSAWRAGVRVPGFYSGTQAVLSGTSAAAPRLARWMSDAMKVGEQVPVRPAGAADTVGTGPMLPGVALDSALPDLDEEDPTRLTGPWP